jgi:hypothetical protein
MFTEIYIKYFDLFAVLVGWHAYATFPLCDIISAQLACTID